MDRRSSAILGWLLVDGALSQAEIAVRAGLDSSTVSLLVRGLESEGMVRRSIDPHDARRRIVRLADSIPSAVVAVLVDALDRNEALARSALTEDEARTLIALLAKIRDALAPELGRLAVALDPPSDRNETR